MPRNAQVVNMAAKSKMAIRWMFAQVEAEQNTNSIGSQALDNFPDVFRQTNRRSNRSKANDWFRNREYYLNQHEHAHSNPTAVSMSRRRGLARTRIERKARGGRERKRSQWENAVHSFLVDEFDRLRAA